MTRTLSPRPSMAEMLEPRRLLSAGAVDTSFGSAGVANPINSGRAHSVFTQVDGKTVVAGTTAGSNTSVSVARYNLDGSLDLTFGPNHNGFINVHSGDPTKPCVADAITETSDGKILVSETINNIFSVAAPATAGVFRLTSQGLLDTSFDNDGKISFSLATHTEPTALAIDASGRILIAGYADTFTFSSDDRRGFIYRLNSNGSTDNSFHDNGRVLVAGTRSFSAIAIDRTGSSASNPFFNSIVATGDDGQRIKIYRYWNSGALVFSFDDDGFVSFNPGGAGTQVNGLKIQGNGKIVVSGTIRSSVPGVNATRPFLARFLATGPLDSSFGGTSHGFEGISLSGQEDVGFGLSTSLSGDLLVLALKGTNGFSDGLYTGGTFQLLSFTPDGVLDHGFGAGGIAPLPSGFRGTALASGPGRRVTVVGSGGAFDATRLLDKGAQLATIFDLSPTAKEAGQQPTHILVGFSERLPIVRRIFLGITGTATSPLSMFHTFVDYSTTGITYATILNGGKTYVDIPANQTYVDITLTPNDDARIEGTEQAVFSILPGSGYDIGAPPVTVNILDNDSTTVHTTADAYVADGTTAGSNFGTASTLKVQTSSTANAITYLKFDLSSVATINFAQLRLFGALVGGGSNLAANIFGVSSTTWTETGIKNSNRPAIGTTKLASSTLVDAIPAWHFFDLTTYLKAQKAAGHNTVSLAVELASSSSTLAQFDSRENFSGDGPQLVLG